jgi:alkylation response protein AidB-like acyl-CoA dehydrogenase
MSSPNACWGYPVADLIPAADTDHQAALRESVRSFVTKHGDSAQVRRAMSEPGGYHSGTWRRLTGELGLTALAVPERLGGAGGTLAEVAVVVSELGRVLLPAPYLSSALAAALVTEAADDAPGVADEWLAGLLSGDTIAALALGGDDHVAVADGRLTGTVRTVMDAPIAQLLLVRATGRLYAVDAAGAKVRPVPAMDPTRQQGDVTLESCAALELPVADGAERALQLTRTMLAVESVGAATRALEITLDYLKTRVQFGRPIGSFQALKHRCADLTVAIASASATATIAVRGAVEQSAELAVLAPLAKLYCTDAFMRVAGEMVQLHGGIGFTWEHDAHLYLKRAKSGQLQFGTPGELRTLIGQRAGLLG